MIITKNDIEIKKNGDWFFHGDLIHNPQVLRYFKANLGRDADGYFILNPFGERLEKGYLKSVHGFPLFVIRLSIFTREDQKRSDLSLYVNHKDVASTDSLLFALVLDSQLRYLVPSERLYFFDESTLAFRLNDEPATPLYARLSSGSMAALADFLIEDNGEYFLHVKNDADASEQEEADEVLPGRTLEDAGKPIARAFWEELVYERE